MKALPSAIVAVALTAAAPAAHAATFVYDVVLDGLSESPPNASPGTGFGVITYNNLVHSLRVEITFSGLLGTTTASHIHAATAVAGVGTAGVATQTPNFAGFPLGVTSGNYDHLFDLTLASSYNPAYVTANGGTTASAENALANAMAAGKAYLNIHTTVVPSGEIRGFLVPGAVPEASTWTMLVVGFGAIGMTIRASRRRSAIA